MKKTIVLGGSRGIGGAIAKRLNEIDNNKVFSYSSSEVDTGNLSQIEDLVEEHKYVDILVLNTGGPPAINFFEIKDEAWQKYHNQLFLGFCNLLQNIHIKNNGYVFLVSSFNIKEPNPSLVLSNAYRLAFVSVFKSLSKIMAHRKISFVNIAPGPIRTDRLISLVDDVDKLAKELPMKYIPDSDEIGRFVSSIVEKEIKYLSGVTINFDGAASNYVL
jgi:3-oxoacyl-[acyl-carrier protein] reductase